MTINPLTSPAALPESYTELAAARAAILGCAPTCKRVAIEPLLLQRQRRERTDRQSPAPGQRLALAAAGGRRLILIN